MTARPDLISPQVRSSVMGDPIHHEVRGLLGQLGPYPSYQGSGISWLDSVPTGWSSKRAKYFLHEVDERSVSGKEELLSVSHKTGVTPRSQKNITMFMAESYVGHKVCRAGDIVINTMWAWMAALGASKQTGIVSPAYGVYRLKNRDAFEPQYLDYLLRTQAYASEYLCRSTGVNTSRLRLYPDKFLEIPILCPPLDEQIAINKFIGHADQKIRRAIRAKKNLIALLSEQKQVILNQTVTKGLDSNVRFKASGNNLLGYIPEHWIVARLKDLAIVQTGLTLGKNYQSSATDSYPYLRVANVQQGRVDLRDVKLIDVPKKEAMGATLHSGDVLMTEGGDIDKLGRGCVWRDELLPCLHQNHLFAVRCCETKLDPEFLVGLMSSQHGRAYFQLTAKQTTNLASTNSTTLRAFPVMVPPIAEQKAILDVVAERSFKANAAISQAQNEIRLLLELRTNLIFNLVTGKLDVREAAIRLPSEETVEESIADADAIPDDDDPSEDCEFEEVEG